MDSSPLIIVSNRGPAQFERDEGGKRTVRRGGGGLVTALSGLVTHRDALWIASAMTDEDIAVSEEEGGPVELSIDGIDYRVLLVGSDPEAYDRFYNVIANPILWFIQHYLWDLSNAPDIRQEELDAWDYGYQVVNDDIADAVLAQIEGRERPLVMLHDYHLYTAPGMIRAARPDAFLHHFVHIPWSQPDSWRILPSRIREAIFDGMLANDIIGFHTHAYCINFLRCCDELLEGPTSTTSTPRSSTRASKTLARAYPLGIDAERLRAGGGLAGGRRGRARGAGAPAQAPDHPRRPRRPLEERAARLHRLRHLPHPAPGVPRSRSPSSPTCSPRARTCPSTPSTWSGSRRWSRSSTTATGPPTGCRSTCKIYENFHDAVARYKHFDLLMVNSIFDGMNLVAKEAPAVNTRDGVLMLSENTGSHEELGDFVISVNPFDIQEQADAIYRALTMDRPRNGAPGRRACKDIIYSRNPGDWVDDQLTDIRERRSGS